MPVTKTAKKALRQSLRKAELNKPVRSRASSSVRKALQEPTPDSVKAAYSAVDKAVKKHLLHANTASRIKSRVARALASSQK